MAEKKRTKKETEAAIRASLVKQLEDRGANVEHFAAMIDDYMFYYAQEIKYQREARKGITIKAVSASGNEYDKENPAPKLAAMCNKQKLAILRELDLTTDTVPPPDESGGDL